MLEFHTDVGSLRIDEWARLTIYSGGGERGG